ncbi:MAG: hypothetical protein ACR2QQ_08255, partial [Gammaproteobacteria bacterium]
MKSYDLGQLFRMLANCSVLVVASVVPMIAAAQESPFIGDWLLWVESGYEARPAHGTLTIEETDGGLELYVEGGPVKLLELEGDRIRFDLDWIDLRDAPHVSILDGVWDNGVIEGRVTEDGEDRGAWRATQLANRNSAEPPAPADLSGIWGEPDYIGKRAFDLNDVGRAAEEVYDETLDDPILRCVSDGLIRMSHGPFDIEVLDAGNRIIMLYEDMHEVRRVYLDRDFPEGVENMNESMGYSVGHWE